jgi:mRNA-degrading endonuclease RelE of RelBE toxin-antitoxin system
MSVPHWGTISMVFIETSVFTRQIEQLISDENYMEMQRFLAKLPTAGDLIRGSNGCRKLRWKVSGRGKRGGIRLIYYWITADDQILMLTAYCKTTTADLTPAQIKALGQLVAHELKER